MFLSIFVVSIVMSGADCVTGVGSKDTGGAYPR